jgi:hypothetical protein
VVNLIFYAFPYVLGGLPVNFEKSPIRFVCYSMFFMHSQIFLGGLPVSFEKSKIRFVFQDDMYSNISMALICKR